MSNPIPETPAGHHAVLVTTKHRMVAFGYATDTTGDTVTLLNARCAIRFGTTGGFLELAGSGPTSRSKIGARAPSLELREVTSVSEVTEAARIAWEQA
jgi:hypothetical protein